MEDAELSDDFEKRNVPDLGRKLAHLEGIMGAYLPRRVFDTTVQQRELDCDKSAFSRLLKGERKLANWEAGVLAELFGLTRFSLDYRIFSKPFEEFDLALKQASVGSYGTTAAFELRERLRKMVTEHAKIKISIDRRLNVGGIGATNDDAGILTLSSRHRVNLTIPLQTMVDDTSYLLLLHDHPAARGTSCLMPSIFAPEVRVQGKQLRLPQSVTGEISFPVSNDPGYRCLYGIQSSSNLANLIGLENADEGVLDVHERQISLLVAYLTHASRSERAQVHITFAEYVIEPVTFR